MSLIRLGNITPGRLGVFAGSLTAQPATVQREVSVEMETQQITDERTTINK